jgi:hypothetical protein
LIHPTLSDNEIEEIPEFFAALRYTLPRSLHIATSSTISNEKHSHSQVQVKWHSIIRTNDVGSKIRVSLRSYFPAARMPTSTALVFYFLSFLLALETVVDIVLLFLWISRRKRSPLYARPLFFTFASLVGIFIMTLIYWCVYYLSFFGDEKYAGPSAGSPAAVFCSFLIIS